MKKCHAAKIITHPVSTGDGPKSISLELGRKYYCSVGSSDIFEMKVYCKTV